MSGRGWTVLFLGRQAEIGLSYFLDVSQAFYCPTSWILGNDWTVFLDVRQRLDGYTSLVSGRGWTVLLFGRQAEVVLS